MNISSNRNEFSASLLRECRYKRGLTLDKLSQLSGVHIATLCLYESGEHIPRHPNIDKIRHAFDLVQTIRPSKYDNFGGNLKAIRVGKGLSISALAKQAGLNRSTIKNLEESIRSPQTATIMQLAKTLNVSTEEFYGE
jgi:transcriptional regulator with XRE-family HTH domain